MSIRKYMFLLLVIPYPTLVGSLGYTQEMGTVNSETIWNTLDITGCRGKIVALSKTCGLKWKDAQGREQTRQAMVVLSQASGTVWVGLPGSRLVEMGNAIIGFTPLHDTLVIHASTNILKNWIGTEAQETLVLNMDKYVSQLDGQSMTSSHVNDKHIRLRNIFGLKALMDLNSTAPPQTPELLEASVMDGTIVLRMKSGVGKSLILTLDEQFNPIKGVVESKTIYEPGKTQPPSLVDELRSQDDR